MRTRILIVEDEPALRQVLAGYIKAAGYLPLSLGDGLQAAEVCRKERFALVILDIMLPGMDGYALCRLIKEYDDTPVILLTARTLENDQLTGFACGADDYVTKPFSPSILMARVQNLLRRSGHSLDDQISFGPLQMHCREHTVYLGGEEVVLTPMEFELLKYLILNKGITLTRAQMLDAVWGKDCFHGERTVDTHIKCLRAKLGEVGRQIKTVIKVGYRLEG